MTDASDQPVTIPASSAGPGDSDSDFEGNGGPLPSRPDGMAPRSFKGLHHIGRALHSRNFRMFFIGQGISVAGTWMQGAALAWLVYRLTGSAAMLGVVGFSSQICMFLLAPFAGTLADRWDRRRLAIITQTLAMLQAFVMAALTLTGVVAIWHIIVLAMMLGVVAAFDIPTRQAMVLDIVDSRDDLPNAIALNSFLVNGGRLVGPSVAGLLIGYFSNEGVCFAVNGVSYLAVIVALAAMRITPRPRVRHNSVLNALGEGFIYAAGSPPIRSILLLLAAVSLMGLSYGTLMPVFAKTILHGGPGTHGVLLGAGGVGALIGAAYLASRRSVLGLERLLAVGPLLLGVSLAGFAYSRSLWLSLAMLMLAGFAAMALIATSNTLLQTLVHDSKRGRVMSFYTMCFMGMSPFGSLIIGGLAGAMSAPPAVVVSAACSLVAAMLFASRLPMLRQHLATACDEMNSVPAGSATLAK